MPRSIKWIAASLGIVLCITVGARAIGGQSLIPSSWKASLLEASAGPDTLVVTDEAPLSLQIGSVVEVHRFTINAGFPYTLRYLSFQVELNDLSFDDVSTWMVYEVHEGEVDYQKKVAQGESFQEGLLKLRFYSDRARGYYGEGTQEFALITSLKRSGDKPSLTIETTNSADLDAFFQWAWVEGHTDLPWSELNFSE